MTEEARRRIESTLCENVQAGALIPGTGGFRKLRHARQAGKRGGLRVIYFPDLPCNRIYMILAYGKAQKDSLTGEEKSRLRELAQALKEEEC